MNEIVATSQYIENFIENNHFNIPVYQRGYSWDSTDVETLLGDIYSNDIGYFIGNILLESSTQDTVNVVDGQQRLTTIYIILLAIYKQLFTLHRCAKDSDIKADTKQEYTSIAEKLGLSYEKRKRVISGKLKLQLLESDQELLQQCVDYVQSEEANKLPNGNRKFMKAYKTAEAFLDDLIQDEKNEEDICDILLNFEDKVMHSIVLPIQLNDLSDVFSVFSSMNSKGQPLTIVDLLKADVLSYASNHSDEVIDMWKELIEILKRGNKELKMADTNNFLQNNYDTFYSTTTSSITAKKSLNRYRKLLQEYQSDVRKFIRELQGNARIYAFIAGNNQQEFNDIEDYPILKSLNQTRSLDMKAAYPILFFIFDLLRQDETLEKECLSVVDYLIYFYVRRNVIQRPKTSNLRADFLGMIRKAEKEENNLKKITLILTELKQLAQRKLDDETFVKMLNEPIYRDKKLTRLLLISLERDAMARGESNYFDVKQHPDNLDEMIKANTPRWTIEHIFPQDEKLPNHWRKMIKTKNNDEAKERHSQFKDKLGNLTLTGYNSEMSNHSFVDKRDHKEHDHYVGLRTPLYLNQTIFDNQSYDEKDTWTEEDINRRTQVLAQRLVEIYKI